MITIPVKPKNSTVPGKVPGPGDLDNGEIATNSADGKIFLKKEDGTVISPAGLSPADQAKLDSVVDKTQGLEWIAADSGSTTDYKKQDHVETESQIALKHDQTISNDPNEIVKDNRYITVKNAFTIEESLKTWVETEKYIKSDGSVQMDSGYTPTDGADVVTKTYLETHVNDHQVQADWTDNDNTSHAYIKINRL